MKPFVLTTPSFGVTTFLVLVVSAFLFVQTTCRASDTLSTRREYVGHGSALRDFESLYTAAKDVAGGGETKVNGLPPVMLSALAERLGAQLPSSRIQRAGCVTSAEQLVGPAARGTYDLLIPPQTQGICVAPPLWLVEDGGGFVDGNGIRNFTSRMEWRDQSDQEELQRSMLPPVEEVFDAVFARKEGRTKEARSDDPQLSFWLLSFVNWFHDDNFRTLPNTDGAFTWSDGGSLHMSQLYGHTEYRQRALRTMSGDGKMKTSSQLGWDFYPPLLADIQRQFPAFDMWTSQKGSPHKSTGAGQSSDEADVNMPYYFAIGDPRFNLHLGHLLWTSIGLYLHNTACDILMQEDPAFSDEDIFQRARVIVFHIIQKIRLQDFVTDSISGTRDYIRIPYDPDMLRREFALHFPYSGGHQPNFLEFNHVYQAWHALIPDGLIMKNPDDADALVDSKLPLRKTMWAPQLLSNNFTIGEVATAFAHTPLTQYAPHNFPTFLRGVTESALQDERAQRMASYNSYRKLVGMDAIASFDQFYVDDPHQLAELYNHDVDSVDFLTGVLADSNPHLPGNFFGDVQLMIVAIFALQDLASSPLILNPVMSSSEYLTDAGWKFVEDFEFRVLLETLTGESHPCPFQTLGSPCVGGSEAMKRPEDVGARFMDFSRVCSYIGVDLTEWYFSDNGYLRLGYISALVSLACVPVLYILCFVFFGCLWPKRPEDCSDDSMQEVSETMNLDGSSHHEEARHQRLSYKDPHSFTAKSSLVSTPESKSSRNGASLALRVSWSCLTVNTVLSLAFVVPTTKVWLDFVTDPYWIQVSTNILTWTTFLPNNISLILTVYIPFLPLPDVCRV